MSVVWATEIRKYLCKGNSEIHETQKKMTKGNEKAKKTTLQEQIGSTQQMTKIINYIVFCILFKLL